MAIVKRPFSGPTRPSPWLYGVVATALILVVIGAGLATGVIHPQRPAGFAVASPGANRTSPRPSTVAHLHGRIAVSAGETGSGGWITFPGGGFVPDAASDVTLPSGESAGLAYSAALGRWVPVPRGWLSPDGQTYVYYSGSAFHAVRVGLPDQVIDPPGPPAQPWTVVWAGDSGAYIASLAASQPGLWYAGYGAGVRQVVSFGHWSVADGRYAFGTVAPSVPLGAANSIVRLDLSSGAAEDVFSRADMRSSAAGVAADGSVVVVAVDSSAPSTAPAQMWLAAPGRATMIKHATAESPNLAVFTVVPDAAGTWISTNQGLFLYSERSGLELASKVCGPLGSELR